MPLYVYEHPKSKHRIEVLQSMKEEHVYVDSEGVKWDRVFLNPNASIDTKIDPFNQREFTEKTGKKSGTIGDLWDESKKASDARKKILGHDPVQEKYFKNYSEKRKGLKHINDPSRKASDRKINP